MRNIATYGACFQYNQWNICDNMVTNIHNMCICGLKKSILSKYTKHASCLNKLHSKIRFPGELYFIRACLGTYRVKHQPIHESTPCVCKAAARPCHRNNFKMPVWTSHNTANNSRARGAHISIIQVSAWGVLTKIWWSDGFLSNQIIISPVIG